IRHCADLALAQIQTVCRDLAHGQWTVFTPVHWSKSQLQVFLGVANACGMDVRVLMPRILGANRYLGTDFSQWEAWEWQWNQLFRVDLCRDTKGWQLKKIHPVPEGGVLDFFRRESRAAAKGALEEHRLDPLHSGNTEQKLFQSWWQWHQGKSDWIYETEGIRLNFSDTTLHFRELHKIDPGTQGMSSYPQMLGHVMDWPEKFQECNECLVEEARLGDFSAVGARWKEVLAVGAGDSSEDLPATHWLFEGVAEKITGDAGDFRPGHSYRLTDGRDVIAIHVPGE
ncbi:MAG: hypothetical protein ACO3NW_11680, partial [Kiritimatiellia bacterium]